MTALLLVLTPLLPAVLAFLALVPEAKPVVRRLAWIAAVPALLTALLVPAGSEVVLDDVLLGLRLGLAAEARLFLGGAAVLWLLAALHASAYLELTPRTPRFTGLFLLCMSGNLGLLVAQDVAGFYLAFAQMSLAAYVLVVHDETAKAYRAGAVYIWLAVVGETCLLLGFLLGASAAEEFALTEVRRALLHADGAALAISLLVAGFGIKMGLVPLHVWLPLAHPAAPSPASAVLSGAMIKAGLFGLMAFLPLGTAPLLVLGTLLVAVGLLTAFYGVAIGLAQSDAKAILAYSSLSQMGVVASGLGVAALLPDAAPAVLAALGLYALHHGLAKGGLFLAVGARQKGADGGPLRPVFALVVAVAALALAGPPLTSGAVAKLGLKAAVETGDAVWLQGFVLLLSVSAIATTVLVLHALDRLRQVSSQRRAPTTEVVVLLGTTAAAVLAGQVLTWGAAPTGLRDAALSPSSLREAAWPVAVGVALAVGLRRLHWRLPAVPEGDLLTPLQGWAIRACDRLRLAASPSVLSTRSPMPWVRAPKLPADPSTTLAATTVAMLVVLVVSLLA